METTEYKPPRKLPGLFDEIEIPTLHPIVRFIIITTLMLAGIYFLFNAVIIILTTIVMLPSFLTGLSTMPWPSVMGLITFLLSSLSFGLLGILLPIIAYSIFRKIPIKRSLLILSIIMFVLMLVSYLFLLPNFTSLIDK